MFSSFHGPINQNYEPVENDPYHRRVLGYNTYNNYYDDGYMAPKGCCGMPLTFWLFILGIFFPFLWLIAGCCMLSRNPYERTWAKACLVGLVFYVILAIFLSMYGRNYR